MPENPDPELKRLEAALHALAPRPANIDRDQLMYDAGRASLRRNLVWPFATAGMTILAGMLTLALIVRSGPQPLVQFVHTPAPAPRPIPPRIDEPTPDNTVPDEPPPPSSYWRLQQTAAQQGLEQMLTPTEPLPVTPPSPPATTPTVGTRSFPATLTITGGF